MTSKYQILILSLLLGCGAAPDQQPEEHAVVELAGHDFYGAWGEETVTCDHYYIWNHTERPALDEALARWEEFLGVPLFTKLASDSQPFSDVNMRHQTVHIIEREGEDHQYARTKPYKGGFGPCSFQIDITIESTGEWKLYAHEIGHVLGLDHSDSEESLMFEKIRGGTFTTGMRDILREAGL